MNIINQVVHNLDASTVNIMAQIVSSVKALGGVTINNVLLGNFINFATHKSFHSRSHSSPALTDRPVLLLNNFTVMHEKQVSSATTHINNNARTNS